MTPDAENNAKDLSGMDERTAGYLKLWRRCFPEPRRVAFSAGSLINEYCPACGFCCGPQEEELPFPLPLLDGQISDRTPEDFYLLDPRTACLDRRGCKALGAEGCRLPRPLRPVACNIFPVVLVGRKLYLYRICPAVMLTPEATILEIARQARDYLNGFSQGELDRLAIARPAEDLAAKYRDLGLSVRGR